MCWNAEVSLKTFMYGLCSALICTYLGTIPMVIIYLIMSFTSMQLLEYFAWSYLDNKKVITYLSIIGVILIFLQLFLISYTIKNPTYRKYMLTLLLGYIILYCIFVLPTARFNMKKGVNGHLVWEWLDWSKLFIMGVLFFYIIPFVLDKSILAVIFTIVSVSYSLYNYYEYNTWGTMWCYFSNVLWVYLLGISVYKYYYGVKNVWAGMY